MLSRVLFYLRYAWRNLRRSARWTTFAVFCIAAGVATVVALRSLGLAIGDSLVDNVRASNHGDITISQNNIENPFAGLSFGGENREEETYSDAELDTVRTWVAEQGGDMSAYGRFSNIQITPVDSTSAGRPQFISTFLIDPQTFPPTNDIYAVEPAGVPLPDLFAGDNSVVISQNLADSQGIEVGDTVRVSNTTEPFTVTGIVPTETEAGINNLFASFFGFAYLDIAEAETLQLPTNPNVISITLPPGTDIEAAARELDQIPVYGRFTTVPELLERNAVIGDYLGRFIVIMGLGALLIGGVGIINTMLVMVGRRTNEIAALKTFGLKGRQVAALFLSEAFLLGVMGSVVGTIVGTLMSGVVNRYGEAFLQQRLPLRFYPESALFGLALGIVVTMVFGVLPVLTANRVRPAIILRPNETYVPAAGCFQSLIALVLVVVVIGGIAGQILGRISVGIIGVAVTLLILGFLVGVMWVIVWIVSHLPSFGVVDLRLALRNLTARRIRTATTLLALSAGMFALSSISFVGAGTRELLQFQLSQNFGGNVLVFPLLGLVSEGLGQTLLNAQLSGIEGIEYNTRLSLYSGRLNLIDGQEPQMNELANGFADELPRGPRRAFSFVQMTMRDSDNPNPVGAQVIAGRNLTPEDAGQRVIVVSNDFLNSIRGIQVGSTITIEIDGTNYDFEVVGITPPSNGFNFGQFSIPPDSIPGSPDFAFNVLQVAPENLNQVLLSLSENPLILSLDISFIDSLLSRLINQFSAIPTLVGLLSLLAAAVAMANTVSLATLERRRQIGVLKAVGLKGRRVLWIMLLENTLIGLLGGVLGIGLSALGVALMTSLGQGAAIPIPRDAAPVAIALIIAAVLIAWGATFLSARPAVSEPVTNVLRYE
jgi:predicted lysophospholipase L1 biosynthesis ABC-type transport system permease subunit